MITLDPESGLFLKKHQTRIRNTGKYAKNLSIKFRKGLFSIDYNLLMSFVF